MQHIYKSNSNVLLVNQNSGKDVTLIVAYPKRTQKSQI